MTSGKVVIAIAWLTTLLAHSGCECSRVFPRQQTPWDQAGIMEAAVSSKNNVCAGETATYSGNPGIIRLGVASRQRRNVLGRREDDAVVHATVAKADDAEEREDGWTELAWLIFLTELVFLFSFVCCLYAVVHAYRTGRRSPYSPLSRSSAFEEEP